MCHLGPTQKVAGYGACQVAREIFVTLNQNSSKTVVSAAFWDPNMVGTVSKVRKGTGFVSAEELPGDDDEDEDEDWIFLIVFVVGAGAQAAMAFVWAMIKALLFFHIVIPEVSSAGFDFLGFLQSVFLSWYLSIGCLCRRRYYRWLIFILTSLFPNSLPSCCLFLGMLYILNLHSGKSARICTKYPGPPLLPLYNPSLDSQDTGETSTEGALPSPTKTKRLLPWVYTVAFAYRHGSASIGMGDKLCGMIFYSAKAWLAFPVLCEELLKNFNLLSQQSLEATAAPNSWKWTALRADKQYIVDALKAQPLNVYMRFFVQMVSINMISNC